MTYLKMILFVNALFIFFYIVGKTYLQLFFKMKKIDNSSTMLIGLSLSLIFINVIYFIIGLSLINSIFLIILILLFSFVIFKIEIFKLIKLNLILNFFLISILISTIAIFTPEQVFIFRGNYWDKINYINSAYSIYNYTFSEIINLSNQIGNLEFLSRLENIHHRPLVSLLLALAYFCNDIDIFRFFFLLQLMFFCFTYLSLKIFFSKFTRFSFIISLLFIFSFWIIYIFEIDSYSHFFSLPFFYLSLYFVINSNDKLNKENSFKVINQGLVGLALFYIYPELFFIFFLLILFFIFIRYKFFEILIYLKRNIIILSVFLITALLSYENNIITTLSQIKIAYTADVDWWGYFGGFLFGKNYELFQYENIENIRKIFTLSENNFVFLKSFLVYFYESKLLYLFFNLIPSFFGFYYLTIDEVSVINIIYIIFLNFLILKILFNNLKIIAKKRDPIFDLLKSVIIIFILFSVSFIFGKNIWSIIKLYSYLGIFVFLLIFFDFSKSKKRINFLIALMILIFPFYKFSKYNSGIFKLDTLPSIINSKMKTNINWSVPDFNKVNCKNIYVDIKDELVLDYVRIKLLSQNYNNIKKNLFVSNTNKVILTCKLVISDGKFKIE